MACAFGPQEAVQKGYSMVRPKSYDFSGCVRGILLAILLARIVVALDGWWRTRRSAVPRELRQCFEEIDRGLTLGPEAVQKEVHS